MAGVFLGVETEGFQDNIGQVGKGGDEAFNLSLG